MPSTVGVRYPDSKLKEIETLIYPEKPSAWLRRLGEVDLDRRRKGLPLSEDPPKPKTLTQAVQTKTTVTECNHAGTEVSQISGVGLCNRCGRWVTPKEIG